MDLGNPATFLEQLLDTFTVLDAQGVVCSQSPWFERILGYEQGKLAGESVFSYIHPEDRPRVLEAFTTVTRCPGETIAAELRFRHRNGSWQVLQAAGKSFVDSAGEIRVVVSARNVTERKLTEEALRESEENYRTLVENLNDVIYVHDASGIVTYISPVVETFGGYKPEEVVGRPFADFVHPDDLPALLVSFQKTLAGHLEPSEFRAIAKSGEVRWVRSSSRPIVKEGCVVGLRGVLTDISERKRAEQQTAALLEVAKDISGTFDLQELLYRVEKRAVEALSCPAMMTFFWDAQHDRFTMVSQYGFPDSALPELQECCLPGDKQFATLAKEQPVVLQVEPHSSAPFPAWFLKLGVRSLLGSPLCIRGKLRGILFACTTVREHEFTQEQIRLCDGIARQLAVGIEAAELYQAQQEEATISSALARVGQELISSLDIPAILARLCRLVGQLLGGERSVIVVWRLTEEKSCQALLRTGGDAQADSEAEALRAFKLPRSIVMAFAQRFETEDVVEVTADELCQLGLNEVVPFHAAAPILCLALRHGKELIGFHAIGYRRWQRLEPGKRRIAYGIAQIASVALANARLLEELERANRLKQDFVGTMSHELRTPLNVILGYNELLREGAFGALSAEQCDILERMNRSATQLLDLINATLDLSRMQSQSAPMTLTRVSIAELFAELEAEFRLLPQKPAISLTWRVEPGLVFVQTDQVKLKMILKNLVGNALKFTDAGEVSTTARAQGEGVEFLVCDTGIGIPSEAQVFIFEPFRQVDSSMTRRHGGVGLGLYIVRQLLELLGGAVSIDSEVGKGSTFRIWIPNREPARKRFAVS
jgi:PAS domain S-box-containing protein